MTHEIEPSLTDGNSYLTIELPTELIMRARRAATLTKRTLKDLMESGINNQVHLAQQFEAREATDKQAIDKHLKFSLREPSVEEGINHPSYYQSENGLEVIDVIEEFKLDFALGNVIKYVLRCDKKETKIRNLHKAMWYLQRELDKEEWEDNRV